MSAGRAGDLLIGPRTTVFSLLRAYPFLEPFLSARVAGFEVLRDEPARTRRARVMTLDDVCRSLETPWTQLVAEIAAEVERGTGRSPRVAGAPTRVADDRRRLEELRRIVESLEAGASLLEAAARWQAATGHLEPAEMAALDAAVSEELLGRVAVGDQERAAVMGAADAAIVTWPGHPADTLRREGDVARRLCDDLRDELDRLGGSPARRRWRRAKGRVSRLVEQLSAVESRFRREQQAWFPALEVHAVSGPQALLAARQAEALEMLRRLRLAVDGDDAASASETGQRLIHMIRDLIAQDERLLEPLARRHFSIEDWAAVRDLEDGVEWGLVPRPPEWPGV